MCVSSERVCVSAARERERVISESVFVSSECVCVSAASVSVCVSSECVCVCQQRERESVSAASVRVSAASVCVCVSSAAPKKDFTLCGPQTVHVALAAVSWGRGDRGACVCSICSSMRGQRESE